jgi:hypothetical protein
MVFKKETCKGNFTLSIGFTLWYTKMGLPDGEPFYWDTSQIKKKENGKSRSLFQFGSGEGLFSLVGWAPPTIFYSAPMPSGNPIAVELPQSAE